MPRMKNPGEGMGNPEDAGQTIEHYVSKERQAEIMKRAVGDAQLYIREKCIALKIPPDERPGFTIKPDLAEAFVYLQKAKDTLAIVNNFEKGFYLTAFILECDEVGYQRKTDS